MSESGSQEEKRYTPSIYVEQTLAIIKPDAIDKADEIEEIILKHGFSILRKRRMHLTPEQTSEFYAEHYGKMFFPSLIAFMSSGPILAMILARDNAVTYWRQIIGPTQTSRARDEAPDSIRALFGTDNQKNAVHGSDSNTSAAREIHFFFPDAVIEPLPTGQEARDYLARAVNPTLQKGLAELCKQKPDQPIIWLSDWLSENNPNKPKINGSGPVIEEVTN
ncbi:nucleoside diphosphate kinase homolog 5-like [Rhopilema esculentum]|uniref:nucleoside diphosphate kinase homolog 5-like n=1 Tax=Rhopilema esculentum TaxID=499914 RepID=UPI0031D6E519